MRLCRAIDLSTEPGELDRLSQILSLLRTRPLLRCAKCDEWPSEPGLVDATEQDVASIYPVVLQVEAVRSRANVPRSV